MKAIQQAFIVHFSYRTTTGAVCGEPNPLAITNLRQETTCKDCLQAEYEADLAIEQLYGAGEEFYGDWG